MQCTNCQADLPENAKFCHECGTPVEQPEAATTEVEMLAALQPEPDGAPEEPVAEPETEPDPVSKPVAEIAAEPGAAAATAADPEPAAAPKSVVEPSPAMPAAAQTPAAAGDHSRLSEERAALASFVDAVLPVLKLPAVVFAAVAALGTLVISLILSTLVSTVLAVIADIDLPDTGGEWWDFTWISHFTYHQIPGTTDDWFYATTPLLMLIVPIISAVAAVFIARSIVPGDFTTDRSTRFPWMPIALYALLYVIANLVLGAFGESEAGVAFLTAVFMSAVVAWLGYILAARMAKTPPAQNAPAGPSFVRRAWHIAAAPVTALVGMIIVASVLTFVANVVDIFTDDVDDGARAGIVNSGQHILDNGWATTAYGMFGSASGTSESDYAEDEDENGDEDRDEDENTSTSYLWDLHRDDDADGFGFSETNPFGTLRYGTAAFIIVLIAGFGTVLLGGLYAGFRLVRGAGPGRSGRDSALTGALVGPVWALTTIPLSWLVTNRSKSDGGGLEYSTTTVEAVEIFFLALLVGAVLGAIGGALASRSNAGPVPPVAPPQTPAA